MTSLDSSHTHGAATFGSCGAANQRLFRINAGVPADLALEYASLLLASANKLTLLSSLENDNAAMSWAAHYLGDMAKALIDDVAGGLQAKELIGT